MAVSCFPQKKIGQKKPNTETVPSAWEKVVTGPPAQRVSPCCHGVCVLPVVKDGKLCMAGGRKAVTSSAWGKLTKLMAGT